MTSTNDAHVQQTRMENAPAAPRTTIDTLYWRAAQTPSDISEHIPVLYKYASTVRRITEFGTRRGASTSAFLFARPESLVAYDLVRDPAIDELALAASAAGVKFTFEKADTRSVTIGPTDLLFIDSLHTYHQTRAELTQASQVGRYIILHDTETFGIRGEDGSLGIWPAVAEFLRDNADWELHATFLNNHGLTILNRRHRGPGVAAHSCSTMA